MADLEIQFYGDDKKIPINLGEICDDSTTHITIPTPGGWKCERPNCKTDYLHKHGTYSTLETRPQYINRLWR